MFKGETFESKIVRLVLSNVCGERVFFSLAILISFFNFLEAHDV